MSTDSVRVSDVIPAPPARIYRAWLDAREHSMITGSKATAEPGVGGHFSAWGGSIRGTTLELEPDALIVQAWRASDFPEGSEDSRLEVRFQALEPAEHGTRVTILHTGLPVGTGHRYEEGWRNFYFERMKKYFAAAPAVPSSREEGARDRAAVEASKRGARAVGTRVVEVGDGSGAANGDEAPVTARLSRGQSRGQSRGGRRPTRKASARAGTASRTKKVVSKRTGKKRAAGKPVKAAKKKAASKAVRKKSSSRTASPVARRRAPKKK